MYRALPTLIFLISLSPGVLSQTQDSKTVADAYLKEYFSGDPSDLGKYYTNESTWSDPTWSAIDTSSKPVTGKENIVSHLKQALTDVRNLTMEVTSSFSAGPYFVYDGWMSYQLPLQNGKVLDIKIKEITVLKVENEKIVNHTDFGDFDTWLKIYREGMSN